MKKILDNLRMGRKGCTNIEGLDDKRCIEAVKSEKNNKFGVWASTHRHHGFDVVLVTVDISRVDTSVRQLFEWTYRFKKANFFGSLAQRKNMCFG